jgi:DNA repair protein RecO (recombination protein O)
LNSSDDAIVLRLAEYSETSQIVWLLTARSGLVRLIAKGVRRATAKRPAVGLDLLEYGEAAFIPPRGEAGLGTLTEWLQRDAFTGLRSNLPALYAGLYAAEATGALIEEFDPHPDVFAALHGLLGGLAAAPAGDPLAAGRRLAEFQQALLAALGYAPNLVACVACGKQRGPGRGAYFSAAAGGLLCRACQAGYADKRRLTAAMLDAGPVNGHVLEWLELLHDYLTHTAGRDLRTGRRLFRLLGEFA